MVANAISAAVAAETRLVEPVEQIQAPAEPVGGNPRLGIFGWLVGILDHERLERGPHEPGACCRSADTHDVWEVEMALPHLTND